MTTQTEAINALLDCLRGELGLGESPAGSNSNKIVKWYNNKVAKIGNGPWCEMLNTYGLWMTGAKELKVGRAYTVYACTDAQKKTNGSSWHYGTKGMRAGDQVYYDWDKTKGNFAYVDHTGTVEKVNGDGTYYVLEGNIGDRLQRMKRDGTYVVGYVRFAWNRLSDNTPPVVEPPKPVDDDKPLVVDGELGPKTIARWQKVMGTTVDGVIDSEDSELVRAVQRKLKSTVDHRLIVDGEGIEQDGNRYLTVGALQRYLKSPVDQVISEGDSTVVRALQRRLNSGKF
jgi:hypothetical protein